MLLTFARRYPASTSLLVLAAVCGIHILQQSIRSWPSKNKHAKYFITFEGQVPANLAQHLSIMVSSTFYNSYDRCNIGAYAMGTGDTRTHNVAITIRPNKSGHFFYRLPIQYYVYGQCGWTTDSWSYQINYFGQNITDNPDAATFYMIKASQFSWMDNHLPVSRIKKKVEHDWLCRKFDNDPPHCKLKHATSFSPQDNIIYRKNYSVNIIARMPTSQQLLAEEKAAQKKAYDDLKQKCDKICATCQTCRANLKATAK